jgi:hypothetical protein
MKRSPKTPVCIHIWWSPAEEVFQRPTFLFAISDRLNCAVVRAVQRGTNGDGRSVGGKTQKWRRRWQPNGCDSRTATAYDWPDGSSRMDTYYCRPVTLSYAYEARGADARGTARLVCSHVQKDCYLTS